jgi:hypothetical protein
MEERYQLRDLVALSPDNVLMKTTNEMLRGLHSRSRRYGQQAKPAHITNQSLSPRCYTMQPNCDTD